MTINHTTVINNLEEVVNQIEKSLVLSRASNNQMPQNPFLKKVISCKIINAILNGSLDMGEKIYFADFDIGIEINIRPIFIDQFENFKLYNLEIVKVESLW
jgi:hypothetical protein